MLRDIIKDTEIYQIIMEEGWEKGLEKGREEGWEKGREKGQEEGREKGLEEGRAAFHQLILEDVQDRFPELVEMAIRYVNAVADLDALKKLARNVVSANSVDQVRALFDTLKNNQK